ncbi:MAG: hypothetical protein WBC04_10210 [Candidatus Acidiferrales bacterium]
MVEETSLAEERRKSIRYRVGAPALFYWKSGRGDRFRGEGITRDISVAGAYIISATCPPTDLPVDLEIILPSGLKWKRRIKAKTRVLRVEHGVGGRARSGFSVKGDCFKLRTVPTVKSNPRSSGR